MPKTPPRHKPLPKNPILRPPPLDDRSHPIPGMRYRVRDKDWAALHGEDLDWNEATALKRKVVNQRKSTTARVECEDVPVPPHLEDAAIAARAEFRASSTPPTAPAPHISANRPRLVGLGGEGGTFPVTPVSSDDPRLQPTDPALLGAQTSALGAAASAAAAANKRREEAEAAAARRELYRKQREEAEAENKRLADAANELDGGNDIPDSEVDDFLAGNAPVPTDEEIKKARDAAAATTK